MHPLRKRRAITITLCFLFLLAAIVLMAPPRTPKLPRNAPPTLPAQSSDESSASAPTPRSPAPTGSSITSPSDAPDAVNPATPKAYSSLGDALAAARHAVEPLDPTGEHSRGADYFAANPGQQLRAWFSPDGIELASGIPTPEDEEPWHLKLRLSGIGRGNDITTVSPGIISGAGSRIEINHQDATVTQWFENRTEGIEQGFTIEHAPEGPTGDLTILLEPEGSLSVEATDSPDALSFLNPHGECIVDYVGLKAWDATGRDLEARMETSHDGTIALVVNDQDTQYPVTVDPLFARPEIRLSEEQVAGDLFGFSVDVSGQTAVIGALDDSTTSGAYSGSAYVFSRSSNGWLQQQKLTAFDGAVWDQFGHSVSISGDSVLVGARFKNAAYIFVRNDSVWSIQAKVEASDGSSSNDFGHSVSIDGNTALVGDPDINKAYVFTQNQGNWQETAQLDVSGMANSADFGTSVALSGNTAIVGAQYNGSAHIFTGSGSEWQLTYSTQVGGRFGSSVAIDGNTAVVADVQNQTAYVIWKTFFFWNVSSPFTASNPVDTGFGKSVAVSGDSLAIAADKGSSHTEGSVYIFNGSGGSWSEQQRITTTASSPGDDFGHSLALDADTLVVGAPGDDTAGGDDAGTATIFHRSNGAWAQEAKLALGYASLGDSFGYAVSAHEDMILVGVSDDDTPAGADTGSAYLHKRTLTGWSPHGMLFAEDSASGHRFGASVSLSSEFAIVGAPEANLEGHSNAGKAYIFAKNSAGWFQDASVANSTPSSDSYFGWSVSLSGQTVAVGAPGTDHPMHPTPGSVTVFARNGSSWEPQAQLPVTAPSPEEGFGLAVSVHNNRVLVGAPGKTTAYGPNSGTAYIFERSGMHWTMDQALTEFDDFTGGKFFGSSVDLNDDIAVIGAYRAGTEAGNDAGSAYVFEYNEHSWQQEAKLSAADGFAYDRLGSAVACSGSRILLGAPGGSPWIGENPLPGRAILFVKEEDLWKQELVLSAGFDSTKGDWFGKSVALSGDFAVVGAYKGDAPANDGGSVFVFQLGELPAISQHPESQTTPLDQAVNFTVTASGYEPITYQWRKNGAFIPGATATTYRVPTVTLTDAGIYDCVVSNIGGTATSAPAVLTVDTLSEFTQVSPTEPPGADGVALVTVVPPVSSAAWRFVGEWQWRNPGTAAVGLTTGNRTIEFRPVTGYEHPDPVFVEVISGGTATFLQRSYSTTSEPASGTLTVTLEPQSLADPGRPVADRAQWRLLGEDDSQWKNSGATVSNLPSGSHMVECKPLPDRTTPPPVNVTVINSIPANVTLTYRLASDPVGTAPIPVPFETVTSSPQLPYAHVGQIRSSVGSGSGFVVKRRVVATAAHVLFDDATMSHASNVEWLFQRDRGTYDPVPQLPDIPRNFMMLDGYAAQRDSEIRGGGEPGTADPPSQELDVAAMWFYEDAGRGGSSGFLASDSEVNQWLASDALKTLVGYPVAGITEDRVGRMHATPLMNVEFGAAGSEHTYATFDIHSSRGGSGGPLCVQFEGGAWYPAAIYIGGTNQTIVRSIDSDVVALFEDAHAQTFGGDTAVGGGITLTSFESLSHPQGKGALQVLIEPALAAATGGWRRSTDSSGFDPGAHLLSLDPGPLDLQFATVTDFLPPAPQTVNIEGNQLLTVIFTYDPLDSDQDGSFDWAERLAGTDMHDASDYLRAHSMTRNGDAFTITTEGKAGRIYQLEATNDLQAGTWAVVDSDGPHPTNRNVLLTDSSANQERTLYRIRVSQP